MQNQSKREKLIMQYKTLLQQAKIQNDFAAGYIKCVNQGLGAIKETKVMRKEKYFLEEFSRTYQQYGEANRKYLFINQLPRMIIETMVVSGLLVMIVAKLAMGSKKSSRKNNRI